MTQRPEPPPELTILAPPGKVPDEDPSLHGGVSVCPPQTLRTSCCVSPGTGICVQQVTPTVPPLWEVLAPLSTTRAPSLQAREPHGETTRLPRMLFLPLSPASIIPLTPPTPEQVGFASANPAPCSRGPGWLAHCCVVPVPWHRLLNAGQPFLNQDS